MKNLAVSSVLLLFLAACGGGGGGTDPVPDPNPNPAPQAPTHAADIQPIWNANCAGCHTMGGTNGGLTLDDGHTTLVDVPSIGAPDLDRVEPGDLGASYLWHKLNGTQASVGGVGQQMPLGGMLSQAELDTIQAWILGGALP